MLNWFSLLPSTLLMLLVIVSGWFAIKNTELPLGNTSFNQTGTLKGVDLAMFNQDGKLQYQLAVEHLEQYDNNHIGLTTLNGKGFTTAAPVFSAKEGLVDQTLHQVTLTGNVTLSQQGANLHTGHFTTDELTLYPDTKTATTALPVFFNEEGTGNHTNAIGLKASANPRQINLLSNVKSVFYAT